MLARHSLRTLFVVVALSISQTSIGATGQPIDAAKVEQLTGAKPTFNKDENVLKVSFPRSDVKVSVDGAELPPFMGLTSWAAFMPGMGAEAMVMGDMVLFQDEVNPAMDAAFAN